MKKIKWALWAALLLAPFAHGADEVFNCWDSSFAYTTLSVEEHGDGLLFAFKTQDLRRVTSLTGLKLQSWGESQVLFGIDKDACQFHPTEPRVMSCFGVTTVDVQYSPEGNKPKKGERLYGQISVETSLLDRIEVGSNGTSYLDAEIRLDQGAGKIGMERLLFRLEDDGTCRAPNNSTP